jgi:hypothetical protein
MLLLIKHFIVQGESKIAPVKALNTYLNISTVARLFM